MPDSIRSSSRERTELNAIPRDSAIIATLASTIQQHFPTSLLHLTRSCFVANENTELFDKIMDN